MAEQRDYLLPEGIRVFDRPEDDLGDLPTIRDIIRQVAKKHGITVVDILSERRARRFAWARQEVYWRASKETLASLPLIARATRRADHTTVLHGIRAHEKRNSGFPPQST